MSTKAKAPATAAPKPSPAFNNTTAKAIAPTRHEGTARTAAYAQPGADGEVHLFSYAGDFIATETGKKGAAFLPASSKAKPAPAPLAADPATSETPAAS